MPRSETLAVVTLSEKVLDAHRSLDLPFDEGRIHINSDAKYVVSGFARDHAGFGSNKDLWHRFQSARAQLHSSLLVRKVNAHASWPDIAVGRINAEDAIGNAAADVVADCAAEHLRASDATAAHLRTTDTKAKRDIINHVFPS